MRYWIFQVTLFAFLMVGILGCAAMPGKEAPAQQVSLSQIPSPTRTVIERLTAGGQIKKIEKEEHNGKVIYDVEGKVNDKDVEYDIAGNGKVLTSEESVAYDSLPTEVKIAVQKYFGSAEGLKASREIEKGETFYEVEGRKAGSTVALKLTEAGKITETEKEK